MIQFLLQIYFFPFEFWGIFFHYLAQNLLEISSMPGIKKLLATTTETCHYPRHGETSSIFYEIC